MKIRIETNAAQVPHNLKKESLSGKKQGKTVVAAAASCTAAIWRADFFRAWFVCRRFAIICVSRSLVLSAPFSALFSA